METIDTYFSVVFTGLFIVFFGTIAIISAIFLFPFYLIGRLGIALGLRNQMEE